MYAWSNIQYGVEKDPEDNKVILGPKVISAGSVVTPSDLGLDGKDDPGWKELVDGEVVRNYAYPDELKDTNTSPQKIVSAQIAAMSEGVDTGVLDAGTLNTLIPLIQKKKYALEGNNEITPAGEVAPAGTTPPTPSGDTPTTPPQVTPPPTTP